MGRSAHTSGNMTNLGRRVSLDRSLLILDPALQSRAGGLDADHAADLAGAVRGGQRLPPVQVRSIPGRGYVVTDGFHTVEAHRLAGRPRVTCAVRPGSWEDAVLEAAAANQQHLGLKRTNADKRRAARMALVAVPHWSDNRIAGHVGVTDKTVAEVRTQLEATSEIPKLDAREGADGKTRGARHNKPEEAVTGAAEQASGVQADDWRWMPLIEFLEVLDHVWEALQTAGVTTAGQAHERLANGDTFGLLPGDVADLRRQVERLERPDEPPARPAPAPPHPFAELMGAITRTAGMVTTAMKGESETARRLHDYLSYAGLVDHPAGEVLSTAGDDGRVGSALSFLPLRGVRKLIDMAGEAGRKKSEREIKALYEQVSGGWVPPAVLRRRRKTG